MAPLPSEQRGAMERQEMRASPVRLLRQEMRASPVVSCPPQCSLRPFPSLHGAPRAHSTELHAQKRNRRKNISSFPSPAPPFSSPLLPSSLLPPSPPVSSVPLPPSSAPSVLLVLASAVVVDGAGRTGQDGLARDSTSPVQTGQDGTGRDGTGRTGRDGTGRDGTGRDGTGRDE